MIVEFNGRKLNKVLPEQLTVGHLEKLEEILEDTIIKTFAVSQDNEDSQKDIVKSTLNSKIYSKILPLIYLNENETYFDEDTYEERQKFFKSVVITDEINETLGKFMSMSFMKLSESILARLGKIVPKAKKKS